MDITMQDLNKIFELNNEKWTRITDIYEDISGAPRKLNPRNPKIDKLMEEEKWCKTIITIKRYPGLIHVQYHLLLDKVPCWYDDLKDAGLQNIGRKCARFILTPPALNNGKEYNPAPSIQLHVDCKWENTFNMYEALHSVLPDRMHIQVLDLIALLTSREAMIQVKNSSKEE